MHLRRRPGPDAVHEGGELGEAGLWLAQLIWLVLITHDVEEPAQLGQGLPAAAFDVGPRLARPGRLVLENALGRQGARRRTVTPGQVPAWMVGVSSEVCSVLKCPRTIS